MPQPKTNPPQNLWPLAACAAAVLVVIWIATGFDVPHSGAKGKVLALPITPAFVFDGKSGANPVGSLTTDGDNLFGRTSAGGQHGHGVIFRFEPASYRMAWNISFTGDDEKTVGSTPRHDSMYYEPGSGLLFGTTIYVNGKSENTSGGGVLFTVDPHGEGYQTLHTFGRSADGNDWKEDGRHAHSCFIPSSDGNKLYGATASGGRANAGTIYTVSLPGKPAYSAPLFTWPKNEKDAPLGNEPHGRPVVYQAGKNDILLGMTRKGGKHGFGVVYRYDTSPGLDNPMQVLHDFAGKEQADGATPFHGNLVLVGTSVYGLTCNGGEHDGGVAFVTTHVDDPAKSRTHVLWHFGGKLDKGPDGKNPYGTLLRHGDWYYGTTDNGGANNTGTIFRFRLDTEGTRIAEYQQLASFDAEAGNRTGAHPRDNLTAIGNRLYGMAYSGGNNGKNLHDSYGTIFAAELPEE